MPTIADIKLQLDDLHVHYRASMKKDELLALLLNGQPGYIYDVGLDLARPETRGVIVRNVCYTKVWDKTSYTEYIGVFQADSGAILFVKGTAAGKGLGRGGAMWRFVSKVL